MKARSFLARAQVAVAGVLVIGAASALPASAATTQPHRVAATAPRAVLTITNCHWHTDGTTYWAHCYATGDPYFFWMHILCHGPLNLSYTRDGSSAHSPEQEYSGGISCFPGGTVVAADVQTSSG
jgi:hypothetical protein